MSKGKIIKYTIAEDIYHLCPKCRKEFEYTSSNNFCSCGWKGSSFELLIKRVKIVVGARRIITVERYK